MVDIEGSKSVIKTPKTQKIGKKSVVMGEKIGQNHRENGQKWKKWAEFEFGPTKTIQMLSSNCKT